MMRSDKNIILLTDLLDRREIDLDRSQAVTERRIYMKHATLWAALITVVLSSTLSAQWLHIPGPITAVTNFPAAQSTRAMASDGAGGMIIAWSDYRSGSNDIYAQRFNAAGVALWKYNGIPICTATGQQYSPDVVSDGAGGAVIAWADFRGSGNVYAQRVDADGSIHTGWTPDGVPMATSPVVTFGPIIASDGAGGAIVAWGDIRNFGTTGNDIYAQHVDGDGTIHSGWSANGMPICAATADQFLSAIASDGSGGAFVAFTDDRAVTNVYDIYSTRIDAGGGIHAGWPANGMAVCTAVGQQANPKIAPDGSGGCVIAWEDIRGGIHYDIYAQRIDGNGSVHSGWTTGGNALCTATGHQEAPSLIGDGSGGAIVTWMDGRVDDNIYAQRIDGNGAIHSGWPSNGAAVSTAADVQQYPSIISDGAGGAIISWTDFRSGTSLDVYAGRIDAGGSIHSGWVTDGKAICLASHVQSSPTVMAGDGQNGAIIAWMDTSLLPADTDSHIYAQRIFADGTLPTTITGIAYDDMNANGVYNPPPDTSMPGWKVYLFKPQGVKQDSAVTATNGIYAFTKLSSGTYFLAESLKPGWLKTHPVSPDTLTVIYGYDSTDAILRDFGNTVGYPYTGSPGGNWSTPGNWAANHVPQAQDEPVIRTTVNVDALPSDSIRALIVSSGGTLNFTAGAPLIAIRDSLRIEPGGTIHYPSSGAIPRAPLATAPVYTLNCYGDWINQGTFDPGISRVIFPASGSNIGGLTTFYDLEISAPLATISDNKTVTDTLLLHYGVTPGLLDTVFISNPAYTAIKDTGRIFRGSVNRSINSGDTHAYRFESPQSYLQFDGTGTYPSAMTMSTYPSKNPPTQNLKWQVVGGTVNVSQNYVTADSIKGFSKWAIGIPGSEALPKSGAVLTSEFGAPGVAREYGVKADGGSGFRSRLQLRYDQSEVLPAQNENLFVLLRGPVMIDTVVAHWNMVSVPLVPDYTLRDSLFPAATSPAFGFSGSYMVHSNLEFGQGYWLRFSAKTAVRIAGDYQHSSTVNVVPGWNMVGGPSFGALASAASTNPPGIVASRFFGYKNGYSVADTLKPLHAYWVKARGSGQLSLPDTSGLPKSSPLPEAEFSRLILGDDENSSTLYFASKSAADLESFELPPVPPDGVFDARYSTGRMLETADPRQVKEIRITVSSGTYPLKIRWEISGNSAASLLLDGAEIPMNHRAGEVYALNPGIRLRLYPSSHSIPVPKEYVLRQNYPNPFNPATTIRYELPQESRVTLKVYNLLGQEVKTIVDAVEGAGLRTVLWQGTNESGYPVASGVYFYRMEAKSLDGSRSFTATKHMLLLR